MRTPLTVLRAATDVLKFAFTISQATTRTE
jgi:hypothetical protein